MRPAGEYRRSHDDEDSITLGFDGDPATGRYVIGRPRLASGYGQRYVSGRVDAADLRTHGVDGGQADREQQQDGRQRHGQFRGGHAPIANAGGATGEAPAAPASTAHRSALTMMAFRAACTVPLVRTFNRRPAKATAARVPTAYSTNFCASYIMIL